MAITTMKKMLEAGVHFGHRSRFWHPKMQRYIYTTRNGVHIINLEATLPMFNDALNFVSKTTASGGSILFVGTKRAAGDIIKTEAIRCGMPYVNHRWLGGMMTNYKTIKASIKRLKDLEFLAEERFVQFGKKEALMMTREMEKLERSLGGIKDLGGIPDVVFVIDIGHEKNAVKEAQKLELPIIGIVDSNHNPEGIDYVVPGNDDSIRAIGFYAREIANAVLEAKAAAGTPAKELPITKAISKKMAVVNKAQDKVQDKTANQVADKAADKAKNQPAKKTKAAPKKAVVKKTTTEKLSKTALNAMKKAQLAAYAKTQDIKINASDTKAKILEKLA